MAREDFKTYLNQDVLGKRYYLKRTSRDGYQLFDKYLSRVGERNWSSRQIMTTGAGTEISWAAPAIWGSWEGIAQTQQLGRVVGRTLSARKDLNLNIRTGGVWRHLRRAGAWSDLCKTKTVLMKGKWDRETGRTWTLIIINIYWASKTVLSISMLLVKKKILLASFCYWTVTAKSYTKCKQDGAIIPCFAGACSPRALCQTASVPPSSWQGRFHNMWKTVSACGSDGSREGREDHWIRDHSLSLDPLYVGYLEK